MKKTILALLLTASGITSAADYYVVVPVKGKPIASTPAPAPNPTPTPAPTPAPEIVVTLNAHALPAAAIGQTYRQDLKPLLMVAGDDEFSPNDVSWSITDGTLPSGIVLTAGELSGQPKSAGHNQFTVQATYRTGSGRQTYAINVAEVVGQVSWTTPGNYSWTVPANVHFINAVAIGGGDGQGSGPASPGTSSLDNSLFAYGSTGRTGGSYSGADGGGRGGLGGSGATYSWSTQEGRVTRNPGAGGGAAGYSGDGGVGLNGRSTSTSYLAVGGGGVGLYGQGASGLGFTEAQNAPPGGGGSGGMQGSTRYASNGGSGGKGTNTQYGGEYGGGRGGNDGGWSGTSIGGSGTGGGGLGWKNNIAVTPGQAIPVKVGTGGAVRIIWGNGRAFPSANTGDM